MGRVLEGGAKSAFPREIAVLPSSFHEQDGERLQAEMKKVSFSEYLGLQQSTG